MADMDSLTDALEAATLAKLGDSITYARAGGAAVPMKAWVEYDQATVATTGSASSVDAISVEVPMSAVPAVSSNDRIAIARIPDRIYQPAGEPPRGAMGNSWIIKLKRAKA